LEFFLDSIDCGELLPIFNEDLLQRYSFELKPLSFLVIQAENLADLYDYCKGLDLARNFQFPTLRQVPFLPQKDASNLVLNERYFHKLSFLP
jgi:hypothetical protein